MAARKRYTASARERRVRAGISIDVETESRGDMAIEVLTQIPRHLLLALKKGGQSWIWCFVSNLGRISPSGVLGCRRTITAGWPLAWTIMGILAILVGVLSLYGSVREPGHR